MINCFLAHCFGSNKLLYFNTPEQLSQKPVHIECLWSEWWVFDSFLKWDWFQGVCEIICYLYEFEMEVYTLGSITLICPETAGGNEQFCHNLAHDIFCLCIVPIMLFAQCLNKVQLMCQNVVFFMEKMPWKCVNVTCFLKYLISITSLSDITINGQMCFFSQSRASLILFIVVENSDSDK